MGANPGLVSQKKACRYDSEHPQDAARNVVENKDLRRHEGDSGHEGGERAHDGNKTGKNDGFAAMPLIERMRGKEMLLLDETMLSRKDSRTYMTSDAVIAKIPEHAGRQQYRNRRPVSHEPCTGRHARREQKRITGQKGRHDKTRFAKDYGEKDCVNPKAVVCGDLKQMRVNMQNEISEPLDEFHTGHLLCKSLVPQSVVWHNRLMRNLFATATILAVCLTVLTPAGVLSADIYKVGFRTLGQASIEEGLRLDINIWYPSVHQPRQLYYPPWTINAARNSRPAAGHFPLLILSHPTPGNRFSFHDTCAWFARHGFIVAAPTHSRDCMDNMSLLFTWAQLETRVKEIVASINLVVNDKELSSSVDTGRIGIIGYGAGGTAALLLGGAMPDCVSWPTYCPSAGSNDLYCHPWARERINGICTDLPLDKAMSDARIKAIAAVSPGFGMLFSHNSFSSFTVPFLMITAEKDRENRRAFHADAIARLLKGKTTYLRLPMADMGALMAECSDSLASELPEMCRSVTPEERAKIHDKLRSALLIFFRRHLGVKNL